MTSTNLKRILFTIKTIRSHKRFLSATISGPLHGGNNILTNPLEIQSPKVSIPEYIYGLIGPFTRYTAFECPKTHRKLTYGDIRYYSRNFSKVLRKKFGLNQGDTALVILANCPDFPVVILGCLEAGVVASTANSMYVADEILRQLKDCQAKIVITSCELFNTVSHAVNQYAAKIPIICVKSKQNEPLPSGAINYTELIETKLDIPDLEFPKHDSVAILPYSSGTTGLPKGVQLSHSNIVSNLLQSKFITEESCETATDSFQEVSPGVLPMFHIYGFTVTVLQMMALGAKCVTLPRFQPNDYIDILKNYPITQVFAAPPLILFLTHHEDVKAEHCKHLKSIMSGAAPLGQADEAKFLEKFGQHIFFCQGYGLTETSPLVAALTKSMVEKYKDSVKGSIGKVAPSTMAKIIKFGDETGTALGPNEQGELLVKGPQVMVGYHNKPEATKEAFQGDWFKTGDLAYYDKNGIIFITDRVKELIKVRGFQVAPAELEEILRDHPKIQDAAVIGIPDMISGEIPRAYVSLKQDLDSKEIYEYVAKHVARYKRLEGGIEIVKEIPKSAAGKILRRKLKDEYLQAHQH